MRLTAKNRVYVAEHDVDDIYYHITSDKNNKPVIQPVKRWNKKKNDKVQKLMINSGELIYITEDEVELSTKSMAKNLWFWTKEEAQEWLSAHFDPRKYTLKPGTLVQTIDPHWKKAYQVGQLHFGELHDGYIDTMDKWALQHSYSEYLDRCVGPWYDVTNNYDHYIMFVMDDLNKPFRVDYFPHAHSPVQFNTVVKLMP